MSLPLDPTAVVARLITLGGQELIIKYIAVSSMALAIVDSIQCLPAEISFVWFSEWSMIKILYFLSRYLMLVEIPIEILYATMSSHTLSSCRRFAYTGSLLALVGVAIAEAILYVRLYALTGRRRTAAAFLLFLFVGINAAGFFNHIKFLDSMEFRPSPFPALIPCAPVGQRQYVTNTFILVLCSELIVLVLTCWVYFKTYKSSKSPLLVVCYRDGLLYFCLLALTSVANIVCNLAAPLPFSFMFAIPQRMLHGILSTRMILHIRREGARKVRVFGSNDAGLLPMSANTTEYSGPESMVFASASQKENTGSQSLAMP